MCFVRQLPAACVAIVLSASCAVAQSSGAPAQQFDVLIRGGRVFDGSGNPWVRADVGIRGDRVVAVGALPGATASQILNAEGLYVTPGFIDTHSHAGGALETPALSGARQLLAQGITTVFVNPDGGGSVDLAEQRRNLGKNPLGVNVALMVPHGSVRSAVLGAEDRAPTADELGRMEALVQKGMDEGAFAFSSGPFYAPGSFSKTDELVALARIGAKYGAPYQSHIRDESDYTIGLLAAVEEVITVAREARTRGVLTHVKALGPNVWGFSAAIVQRVERAREMGVEVFADQYPYDASSTSLAAALLPRWAQAGGTQALRTRLTNPANRAKIVAEMRENLARRGGADRIKVASYGPDRSTEGRSLAEIAKARNTPDLVETALGLISAGDVSIVSFNMLEDDIVRLMRQPWTMTASDGALIAAGRGVPHPRGNGAFTRKLRKYVLDDAAIDLASAIRSMTSLPASVYNVRDRGVIRAGAFADVVVFDAARIRDRATYDTPHEVAEGMVHIVLNGGTAMKDGAFISNATGQVLRRP